jgi:DnaJ-class molecular chaperone
LMLCRVMDPNAAEDPNQPRDAYEVLGVPLGSTPGEIKKRYMRLSLLIHPDKCSHPRANDAFQAVSAAAKELQVRPTV